MPHPFDPPKPNFIVMFTQDLFPQGVTVTGSAHPSLRHFPCPFGTPPGVEIPQAPEISFKTPPPPFGNFRTPLPSWNSSRTTRGSKTFFNYLRKLGLSLPARIVLFTSFYLLSPKADPLFIFPFDSASQPFPSANASYPLLLNTGIPPPDHYQSILPSICFPPHRYPLEPLWQFDTGRSQSFYRVCLVLCDSLSGPPSVSLFRAVLDRPSLFHHYHRCIKGLR